MRGTRNILLLGTLLAGAGIVAYRVLLTDEARQSLARCAREVCDVVKRIDETLEGTQSNGTDAAVNAQQTAREWEMLGY